MKSAKWEFEFHKVTCCECHDVHQPTPMHLRTVMKVDGTGGAKLEIRSKIEDNSLCLACHAGFGPFASLKREDIAELEKNRDTVAAVVEQHTPRPRRRWPRRSRAACPTPARYGATGLWRR